MSLSLNVMKSENLFLVRMEIHQKVDLKIGQAKYAD